MIFQVQNLERTEGNFLFSGCIHAVAHPCLNKPIFIEFWKNFTYGFSDLIISETEKYIFSIGNAKECPLDGNAYSISIEKSGLCVCAESEKSLIQGFMTLLDRLQAVDRGEETVIEAKCCQIKERASIQNRMVHFCIFPETELWELQRFIRFCGALKYTHVVLEFWGMLKFDCMKELSWSHGFTKEQIKPLIQEANDLGLEIIPMFNHWGHASAGRVMHGKHVVLDQNPALQTYFSEDGWCWDISKAKVKVLLRQIRSELIELCGEGSYFHIGCDEAYHFDFTEENKKMLLDFINDISNELNALDRRTIVWGDMFLFRHSHYNFQNRYTCNAPSPEIERYFLNGLSKQIVIADWQYNAPKALIETASVFKKAGFDCLVCPWDVGKPHLNAALSTVKQEELMGFMHTTWHTLSSGMPYVVQIAADGFAYTEDDRGEDLRTKSAALLRKVMPIGGDYSKAGWSKYQIGSRW